MVYAQASKCTVHTAAIAVQRSRKGSVPSGRVLQGQAEALEGQHTSVKEANAQQLRQEGFLADLQGQCLPSCWPHSLASGLQLCRAQLPSSWRAGSSVPTLTSALISSIGSSVSLVPVIHSMTMTRLQGDTADKAQGCADGPDSPSAQVQAGHGACCRGASS